MLKKRIITAVILGSLIILVIFKLPNSTIAIVFAGITLIGAWEWSTLIGLKNHVSKLAYITLIGAFVLAVWLFMQPHENVFLLVTGLWWLSVVIMLTLYKSNWLRSVWLQKLLEFSGFVVLVPAWLALTKLHDQGPETLMFLLALVWVADIAAYFVGKRFGKNKLAPLLSPGKSREGVLGALLASLVMAVIGLRIFTFDKQASMYFIGLCVLTALISVAGDLYESLLKRKAGAKDSGTILPGHGGVLDRIDSLTAAAPVYLLGLYWILSC